MKELAIKSMKLNRDLDRYVEQALEQGRPVKIGWGEQETRGRRMESLAY